MLGANALSLATRRTAMCIKREGNAHGLLPGADCNYDHQCLSGRCNTKNYLGHQCFGLQHYEYCLSHDECEHGFYCDKGVTDLCLKVRGRDQTCTEGQDICEVGYYCASVAGAASVCVEVFSIQNGVQVSQTPVCKSGF